MNAVPVFLKDVDFNTNVQVLLLSASPFQSACVCGAFLKNERLTVVCAAVNY